MQKSESQESLAQNEQNCPVCQNIMLNPIKQNCSHHVCQNCTKYIQVNQKRCPLCRKNFKQNYEEKNIDREFQDYLIKKQPLKIKEYEKNMIQNKDKINVKIIQGNTQKELKEAKWTTKQGDEGKHQVKQQIDFYLINDDCKNIKLSKLYINELTKDGLNEQQMLDQIDRFQVKFLVKSVTFKLHETCKPPEVKFTAGPFHLHSVYWGQFDVEYVVEWNDVLQMGSCFQNYELDFDGGMKYRDDILIDQDKLQESVKQFVKLKYKNQLENKNKKRGVSSFGNNLNRRIRF